MSDSKPQDIFFFSHSRTASNLLCRLLSDQPGWTQSEYHFMETNSFASKVLKWDLVGISQEQRAALDSHYRDGFQRLQVARSDAVSEASEIFQSWRKSRTNMNQGKSLLAKNHVFFIWEPSKMSQSLVGGPAAVPFNPLPNTDIVRTNPTIFSDKFITSWRPLFIIRHPALCFESWYRTELKGGGINVFDKQFSCQTTFRYSRELYEWFVENASATTADSETTGAEASCSPIVVEADDIIAQNDTVAKLCKLCGMDPERLVHKWEVSKNRENEKYNARHQSYMSTFWNSTSVDKSKSSQGVKVEEKYKKWQEEFGTELADILSERVKEAMPDYLYLKSKKM